MSEYRDYELEKEEKEEKENMARKYCPFMSYQNEQAVPRECMKHECALWDSELKKCSIATIALSLLAQSRHEILKMKNE